MKVVLFGATGMVGQGVLRQCLLDPTVDSVLSVGRKPSGVSHPKLRDFIRPDMFDFTVNPSELSTYDACFFCLGVSSVHERARIHSPYVRPHDGLVALLSPLWPILQWLLPNSVITTEELGRAMIFAARDGSPKRVLESADLVALGRHRRGES